MISNGFVPVPRSVLTDPRYKSARLKYQKVLWVIFEIVAFKRTSHSIRTKLIQIERGQFLISERKLVELCNLEVIFEEDKIDKNTVHRSIAYWKGCGFVNQEVNHGKNILTITVPEFYESGKTDSEPESEFKVNQQRTTKEQRKEQREEIRKDNDRGTSVPKKETLPSLDEKKKEVVERNQWRLTPEQQLSLQMLKDAEINTSEETLSFWARTYETDRLRAVVNFAKQKPRKNLGGFIQDFLKKNKPVPTEQTVTNRQVAELYAANFKGIILKPKHCKIGEIELSYEMNPEIFYQTIDRHTENY